ncbi:MAG: hypothetical protein NTV38_03485, partial [Chloroflexi bacterium]|nr:hypothetical protein [Chloroflexota bacterium]
MKIRLTILVILLSLFLTACSLAEDITPPAGYSSPTSLTTIVPATQTPEPPSTAMPTPISELIATTPETTPVVTDSTTPSAEVSPTAQPSGESTPAATDSTAPAAEVSPTDQPIVVVIDGTMTLASGAAIPDGTIATLLLYDASSGQVTQTLTTPILSDGKYEFTNIPAD